MHRITNQLDIDSVFQTRVVEQAQDRSGYEVKIESTIVNKMRIILGCVFPTETTTTQAVQ